MVNKAFCEFQLLGGVFGLRRFALVRLVQFIRVIKRVKDKAPFRRA